MTVFDAGGVGGAFRVPTLDLTNLPSAQQSSIDFDVLRGSRRAFIKTRRNARFLPH